MPVSDEVAADWQITILYIICSEFILTIIKNIPSVHTRIKNKSVGSIHIGFGLNPVILGSTAKTLSSSLQVPTVGKLNLSCHVGTGSPLPIQMRFELHTLKFEITTSAKLLSQLTIHADKLISRKLNAYRKNVFRVYRARCGLVKQVQGILLDFSQNYISCFFTDPLWLHL